MSCAEALASVEAVKYPPKGAPKECGAVGEPTSSLARSLPDAAQPATCVAFFLGCRARGVGLQGLIHCCIMLMVWALVAVGTAGSERLGRSCHLRGWPGAQHKAHSELDLKHRTWFLGLQVGSYRCRSRIEGLYTFQRSLTEAIYALNSPPVVSFNG